MRTSMVHALLAVAVGSIGCTSNNSGPQTQYGAMYMNSTFIVPDTFAAPSTGAASLVLNVNSATNTITGTLTISAEPSTGAFTVGHIHAGASGSNGAVALNLCGTAAVPANAATGNPGQPATPACAVGAIAISYTGPVLPVSGTSFATFASAVESETYYVQLHNAVHPGGDIRGQILRILQSLQ
jgi:hypothetical protein